MVYDCIKYCYSIGKACSWGDLLLTSLTEFMHQMRSGDLLAYLSLNCLSHVFVADGRTNGQKQHRNALKKKKKYAGQFSRIVIFTAHKMVA